MSVIKANKHQVGSNATASKNIVLEANTDGDLVISKGVHDGTLTEVLKVKNSGGIDSSAVGYDGGTVQDVLDAVTGQNGAASVGYTPAGTGAAATTAQEKLRESVSVKDFGAKGDGVTDDTAAFVAANTHLMTKTLPTTNQVVESQYVTLVIPEGIYKISGHRIFGSQVPTGSNGTAPPRMLQILGQGASLIWDVINEDDELFYFDGTIANPRVQGLSIFTTHASSFPNGAGNIFRLYSNLSLTNQANASKLHVEDVSVWPGRRTSGGSLQRPKWAFYNTGNSMCDQMLIQNSRFGYVQKVWMGENDQAVNITFSSCAFVGLSSGTAFSPAITPKTVYFDFTRMNDNFNVVNCSFSVQTDETLIKTTSPTSGGLLVEDMGYNFNFDNNRFEIVTSASAGSSSWKLCDMNFGRLNFRNTSLRLGGASSTVRTKVRAYQRGNLNFDNVQFNQTDFYFPVSGAESLGGGLPPYGAYLTNCHFQTGANTTFAYTDGTTDYAMKDILISSSLYWRSARFVDCSYQNRNGMFTWEFVNANAALAIAPRKTEKVSFARGGYGFGQEFTLPPYQAVKKITVNMSGSVPDTYDAFRVWLGDRTLSNTYDVDNIRPDIRKNEYVLFEGNSAIFYDDQSLNSVEVAFLSSGSESNSIPSEITVEYAAIDARSMNITTNADQIKTLRANRNISSGTTAQRPNIDLYINQQYFDTTLSKPIWWSGSVWKDAAGTTV